MNKLFPIFILILAATSSHAQHSIKYIISPLGNLVYQLDCMAEVSRFHCSKQDFSNLWQTEIENHKNDEKMLIQWKQMRVEMDQTMELVEEPETNMLTSVNFPRNVNNTLNLLEKIRIMAFAAKSQTDYQQVTSYFLSPQRVSEEQKVLNHFMPRFTTWFEQQTPGLNQFVAEAIELTTAAGINELLTDMRIFYRAELPAKMTLPVYLIAHPQAKAATSGLVFNQNSLIEVLKGEQAKDRLAVVLHEIAHFYHESANLEWQMKVMNQFTAPNSATGVVGYYLFNEAMAAALGNGLLEERLQDQTYFKKYLDYPMSFYADLGIDTSAKAALSLVKKYIKNKKAMDDAFLNNLDQQWSKALAEIKDSPKQRLRHVGVLIVDENHDDIVNDVFNLIRPSSAQVNTGADFQKPNELIINKYAALDTIIVAGHWQQLEPLKLINLVVPQGEEQGIQVLKTDSGAVQLVIVSQSKPYILQQLKQVLSQATW